MTVATIKKEKMKRGFASLLNQFGEPGAGNQLMSLAPVNEPQTLTLTERINAVIAAGASFDVGADSFQIHGASNLSEAEKEFLNINKISVLCTLQQTLLVKHLFSQKPEFRQIFVSKVEERSANTNFEAVREITGKWFARLLDTMADPPVCL